MSADAPAVNEVQDLVDNGGYVLLNAELFETKEKSE